MTPEGALKPSKVLSGVYGVQLLPHSPFEFQAIKQHGDSNQLVGETSTIGSNQWLTPNFFYSSNVTNKRKLFIRKVWQQLPPCLKPMKCSLNGDKTTVETVVNVLTSLPFISLGIQASRRDLNCKIYANSLIGVGIASSLYHISRGKLRRYFRWADYTMIATSTVCLSRALRNDNSKLLMAASTLLLPIQPLMVSAVHTGLMEVEFAKRALEEPNLRVAHNVHKMSSLVGGALFIADDIFPETPFLHAGWHLAAAVGVGTCNKLLD